MVTETKISILNALDQHSEGLHLRRLAETVNGSFPNVRRFVLNLKDEGIVKTEQQGNLLNIKLNDSISTMAYLKMVHTTRFLALPKDVKITVGELFQKLINKPLISLIFDSNGSKNLGSKENPLSILLVYQTLENVEGIKELVSSISSKSGIKINLITAEYYAFEKGFLDKEHAFSNKIRKDSILLYGVEHYYNLLWRFLK